ncbi:MAG: flagellar biosynthetic protein FliO [Rhodocyclaceae bacterium]|nr:flagellar biosynthetic protein FliO [Rhodocyclaceae bacterium]MBX3678365.1 flagellar biosynthetic protein FliO [Rhodocyclaceae bacterium]MCB1893104.1 flagellar biosynthetic protein FliO [Rhodocyclaceae bacterium]MCP5297432.1 flagellar biosynthetic protein FliO [Zoogloeaceae bacterium]MCW5596435.1 flagellar biosynthetic protein FliO [Rhodocyclaceae bacterium]
MRLFSLLPLIFLPRAAVAQTATLPEAGAGLLQVVLALGAVIAALIGGLWLLKRLTSAHGPTGGALRVISGTSVGPRERVVLLEVEDTWLVVGVAPGQVNALHQMPKGKLAVAAPVQTGKDFGAWLKQMTERRNAS